MKQCFKDKNFIEDHLEVIGDANVLVESYARQGFSLTLRQLYYQFVVRGLFPDTRRWSWNGRRWVKDPHGTKNADPNYRWLASIINDARLAGLVDWVAIEDRTRNLQSNAHWSNAGHGIRAIRNQFRVDLWATQPRRVEVWIEKEALIGVVADKCEEWDVPYFACRGYVSQSEQWRAYRRSLEHEIVVLHFGDHDPSGIDMTRDNDDRLNDVFGGNVIVERLALNMDQIREHNPPPDPAKVTDSRYKQYRKRYGDKSWELDALEPSVINDLIETNVQLYIEDEDAWNDEEERQEFHRELLGEAIDFVDSRASI